MKKIKSRKLKIINAIIYSISLGDEQIIYHKILNEKIFKYSEQIRIVKVKSLSELSSFGYYFSKDVNKFSKKGIIFERLRKNIKNI